MQQSRHVIDVTLAAAAGESGVSEEREREALSHMAAKRTNQAQLTRSLHGH